MEAAVAASPGCAANVEAGPFVVAGISVEAVAGKKGQADPMGHRQAGR